MKKMTKKEFTRETINVIEALNDKELEIVRKGLYIIYNKLQKRGHIHLGNLNDLGRFLLDIGSTANVEFLNRMSD